MSARRSIKLCGVWLCVGTQAAAAQPPPEAPVPELVGGTAAVQLGIEDRFEVFVRVSA